MTARTCNNCGQEFDTGECGANHGCSEQVTSEKETPVYTTTYAFGVVPDTPKTVEEVVDEFDAVGFLNDLQAELDQDVSK